MLRTLFRALLILAIILIFNFYSYSEEDYSPLNNDNQATPPKVDYRDAPSAGKKAGGERPDSGISAQVGKSAKHWVEVFGQPSRKDPSSYGYEWWIYNEQPELYMQAGVEGGRIVTVYVAGSHLNIAPYKIGQSIEDIYRTTLLDTEIVVKNSKGSYRFELSEEDLNIRPLVQLGEVYAQLYIDKFTGSLSSVRFMSKDTLIRQRPYELAYRGELVEPKPPDEAEWRAIEAGSEQQIFDLTNVLRRRYEVPEVAWSEETSQVAFKHSRDMHEQEYFSHESPTFGDLAKRLQNGNVEFQSAGENIASLYMDGPAAVEGWLNSEGHRKTLLNKDYTELGVGVYEKNYTQNFIKPK